MSAVPVRYRDAKERVSDFGEVCEGYNEEEALAEASRCLQCKNPSCVQGCPALVKIPSFISLIREKKYDDAISAIRETNSLPGVCGRVCPQEQQCEAKCILASAKKQVAIGKLERFAADISSGRKAHKQRKNSRRVAVVGSGPASLSCAADLAAKGYSVTVFEALHKPGGVLRYGIPEFRLPRKVLDAEIDSIRGMGVEFVFNYVVGKAKGINSLASEFDAVFLGTGAGTPSFMGIAGEDLCGVYSANEYLTRINLMRAHEFPKYRTPVKKGSKVVVVGGGNVAVDAARVAKRLGADVTVVYRRSFAEMPARVEEIKNAQEEGIDFLTLTNPVRILGSSSVEGVECVQMRLGEEDESGRKSPVPIEGTEFTISSDQVIIAIGQIPNPIIARSREVMTAGWNKIVVNQNLQTSVKNVFAGGDSVSGAATVIKAVGDGKKAAQKIDEFLNSASK